MKIFRIKTKKDWLIALIFSGLLIYAAVSPFSSRLQNWLLQFGNPKLTNLNQPASFGNVIITLLIMTLLIEALLIVYHRPLKYRLLLPLAGFACAALLFAAYLFNCNLIVSVIGKEAPTHMTIGGWSRNIAVNLTREEEELLINLCETLQPVSPEKEAGLEERFYQPGMDITADSLLIWIHYPPKYGHSYSLMVCVYEDMIFIRKGYGSSQKEIVTFFEDNGILDLLNAGMD